MKYFVLLNNYVTLVLQKHVFLVKSDIRHFFVRSNYVWKLRCSYVTFSFVNLLYLFLHQNYIINASLTNDIFFMALGLRFFVVFLHYVWKWGYNSVSFLFVIVKYFYYVIITITNYYCYLFVRCSFVFYNIRITLYFGMFKLRMAVTLQLRFVFVRQSDVFFITSQLRYLFVRCSCYIIFCYVRITYGNYIIELSFFSYVMFVAMF